MLAILWQSPLTPKYAGIKGDLFILIHSFSTHPAGVGRVSFL